MADAHRPAGAAEPSGVFWWLKGRAGRREYWTHFAVLLAVSALLGRAPPIVQISPTVVLMFLQIRRVHDLGRSGWWAVAATVAPIVLIVPVMMVASLEVATITGVILEVLLIGAIGAPPGDADDNRFGPPPPFTLKRVLIGR